MGASLEGFFFGLRGLVLATALPWLHSSHAVAATGVAFFSGEEPEETRRVHAAIRQRIVTMPYEATGRPARQALLE